MKKIIVLGITLVLLLGILTGCPNGNENQPQSARMVFVDDINSPNVEFTIDENLRFRVRFITFDTLDPDFADLPGMELGVEVTGRVMNTQDSWQDNVISGTALEMSSSNELLRAILAEINDEGGVDIRLTYSPGGGTILSVTVYFPNPTGDDSLAEICQIMMGGIYFKIDE